MVVLLCLLGAHAARAADADPEQSAIEAAKQVITIYAKLEAAYDTRIADLYANDARITMRRVAPDGTHREMQLTGAQMKKLIQAAAPYAKAGGDKSRYSNFNFKIHQGRIYVTAKRYSVLRKHTGPHEWILAPSKNGTLLIVGELIEAKASE